MLLRQEKALAAPEQTDKQAGRSAGRLVLLPIPHTQPLAEELAITGRRQTVAMARQ